MEVGASAERLVTIYTLRAVEEQNKKRKDMKKIKIGVLFITLWNFW